jgi:hypothetical protein
LPASKERRRFRWIAACVIAAAIVFAVFDFVILGALRRTQRSGGVTVASFRADFLPGTPKIGWRYLWNNGRPIGSAANYTDLHWNETAAGYTPEPDAPVPARAPVRFLKVSPTGGHPGQGPYQTKAEDEFYVIYAFAVPTPGRYRVANSFILRRVGARTGTVHLRTFVNDRETGLEVICRTSEGISFDRELGTLGAGDVIYVAIGPGEVDAEDGFDLDFSIMR